MLPTDSATADSTQQPPPSAPQAIVSSESVLDLVALLRADGFEVIGPKVRNGAVAFDKIEAASDLAAGVRDEDAPGSYRLASLETQALFHYTPGPSSFKQFLRSPSLKLCRIETQNRELRILPRQDGDAKPLAFIGVRACDIAGLRRITGPLRGQPFEDLEFGERAAGMVVIATECQEPSRSCFCASTGTGPVATAGFDILLAETDRAEYAVAVGSDAGRKLLDRIPHRPPEPEDIAALDRARAQAAAKIRRKLDQDGLRDALLSLVEDECWNDISKRCFLCGNCTQVCPTCFCATVEDSSNLDGSVAERWRKTDSCFTSSFSYIHGGSVRASGSSRYRQWIMHKFVYWQDQFGELGCVGCGRCITWCPAGIDLTDELETLRKRAIQYGREE